MNSFFLLCDNYNLLQEYKIARLRHQIPNKSLILATIKQAIIRQFITDPLIFYFLAYPLLIKCGSVGLIHPENDAMFTNIINWNMRIFFNTCVKFAICEIGFQWLFYFTHRMLHLPLFYGKIHKQHHEYKGTIGFAAECMFACFVVIESLFFLFFLIAHGTGY